MSDRDRLWRESLNETRPGYILAIRAQALDQVQELIAPDEAPDWETIENTPPTLDVWRQIVQAAFPPPPMASADPWMPIPNCVCPRCHHYWREVWYGADLDKADDPTKSTEGHRSR